MENKNPESRLLKDGRVGIEGIIAGILAGVLTLVAGLTGISTAYYETTHTPLSTRPNNPNSRIELRELNMRLGEIERRVFYSEPNQPTYSDLNQPTPAIQIQEPNNYDTPKKTKKANKKNKSDVYDRELNSSMNNSILFMGAQ